MKTENKVLGLLIGILIIITVIIAIIWHDVEYIYLWVGIGATTISFISLTIAQHIDAKNEKAQLKSVENTGAYRQLSINEKRDFILKNLFHFFEIKRAGNVEEFWLITNVVHKTYIPFKKHVLFSDNQQIEKRVPIIKIKTYGFLNSDPYLDKFIVLYFKSSLSGVLNIPFPISSKIKQISTWELLASVNGNKKENREREIDGNSFSPMISKSRKKNIRIEILRQLIDEGLIGWDRLDADDKSLLNNERGNV